MKLPMDEIEENGIAYVRAKDGEFYERSPCGFCWQPESAMGTKHKIKDCPFRAKATNKDEQQRLISLQQSPQRNAVGAFDFTRPAVSFNPDALTRRKNPIIECCQALGPWYGTVN